MAEPASGSVKSSGENETTGAHLSLPANTTWPEGESETIQRLPRAASEETVRPGRILCAAELRRRNPSAADWTASSATGAPSSARDADSTAA